MIQKQHETYSKYKVPKGETGERMPKTTHLLCHRSGHRLKSVTKYSNGLLGENFANFIWLKKTLCEHNRKKLHKNHLQIFR